MIGETRRGWENVHVLLMGENDGLRGKVNAWKSRCLSLNGQLKARKSAAAMVGTHKSGARQRRQNQQKKRNPGTNLSPNSPVDTSDD